MQERKYDSLEDLKKNESDEELRDLAKFAAVWVSAVERPPTADYMTVRQARIVVADVSSVKLLQGLLKDG